MKTRILLLGLAMVFTVGAAGVQAQNSDSHLKFKGIPLDGSMDNMVSQLETKGFKQLIKYDANNTIMIGDFAGYKNCQIFVVSNAYDNVKQVAINFSDDERDWYLLFSQYSNLKNMLTTKYGTPYSSVERFNCTYQPQTDTDKMYYARRGDCEYESLWVFHEGSIKLIISHLRVKYSDYCYVTLIYLDKQNHEADNNSAIDDL